MSSTKFDVQYVAELARINLTPEEINTFQSQLGHVLEHVEKLNQLDLTNVEPTAHSFPIYNVFREDREQPSLPRDLALSNAPRQAHGLFIVTKVVEESCGNHFTHPSRDSRPLEVETNLGPRGS